MKLEVTVNMQLVTALGVPPLVGLISVTGRTTAKESNIDNYTPINERITEYNTVAELLR